MQVTTFTSYALGQVLKQVVQGWDVAGYTARPGGDMNGLFIYSADMPKGYVGFRDVPKKG
jgi:hypothetical protein